MEMNKEFTIVWQTMLRLIQYEKSSLIQINPFLGDTSTCQMHLHGSFLCVYDGWLTQLLPWRI